MVTHLLALAVLVACQGNRDGGTTTAAEGGVPVSRDAAAGSAAPVLVDAITEALIDAAVSDESEPADPGKVIAELGAIPAWQAVIDRAQLLGRRNLHGIVYGRIGPAILIQAAAPEPTDAGVPIDAGLVASPYVWLVDDTEGNGSLGIRVALGGKPAAQGDRVAVGGAWYLDEGRRWYWKVDSLQAVPAATPSDLKDPQPPVPSHDILNGNLAAGSRTITVGRDHDAVYFQIVGPPPTTDGEGWLVADELGDTPFAFLTLPGERASYGGQDMRAPDERWQLRKAQTYWVRIGKIRRRPDKPAIIHARTAPIRVN